jgi:hypothetical protein
MDDAAGQRKRDGAKPTDENLARISPLVHGHTKMLGAFPVILPKASARADAGRCAPRTSALSVRSSPVATRGPCLTSPLAL